jgi:hypothetical protein
VVHPRPSSPLRPQSYERKRSGPLDASPWQQQVGDEWHTEFQTLLVGLTKEPNAKPAYIEIIGTDAQLAGRLIAYEADQLGEILRELAATLRGAEGGARVPGAEAREAQRGRGARGGGERLRRGCPRGVVGV